MSSGVKLLIANEAAGEHAPSLYAATCTIPNHPSLDEDKDCDVCVIGAGYTGLSTAIQLRKIGYSVIVLEANRIGWGASGRNGGQLGSGFNMDQSQLEKKFGVEKAKTLWDVCENAKQSIHSLVAEYDLDIEYQPGIVCAINHKQTLKWVHGYCDKLNKEYGYDKVHILNKADLQNHVATDMYIGGAVDYGAGHVHPLKLCTGLADVAVKLGTAIHENSLVTNIDYDTTGATVQTSTGTVKAQKVVLACNGYLDELEPRVSKRVAPINNYIVATEPLGSLADELLPGNNAVFDLRFVVNYFRLSQDKRMVFGGGESYGYRFPDDIAGLVRKHMVRVFPQLQYVPIEYAWGGTLAITRSRLPHVRRVSAQLYSASGYSGQGVALSVESGKAIANAIHGDDTTLNALQGLPCKPFPGGSMTQRLMLGCLLKGAALLDKL